MGQREVFLKTLSPIVGAIGVALAAVFVFAVTNMDSPFFKADDVFRPQGQIVDVADRPGSLDNSDESQSSRSEVCAS